MIPASHGKVRRTPFGGGALLKRGQLFLLLLIATAVLYCPASWADGTDPHPIGQGCGGSTVCDASVLYPGQTSLTATMIFVNPGDTVDGVHNPFTEEAAFLVVVNFTGAVINSLNAEFTNAALTFGACGDHPLSTGGDPTLFTCSGNNGAYTFSGLSLCSADPEDIQDGHYVDDSDDVCSAMIIGLELGSGETIPEGTEVIANVSIPGPSSALLLICGLAVGLVGLKSRRPSLV